MLGPLGRRNASILFALMLVGAAFEVIGIAVVPAFIGLFLNPAQLEAYDPTGVLANLARSVEQRDLVLYGVIFLVAVFAIKTAFLILNFYLQVRFVTRRRIDFSRNLMRAYMRAPYTFHLTRNTSELLRNVNQECGTVAQGVIAPTLELCTRSVILVAVMTFLLFVEPWITLYWFGLLGVAAGAGFYFTSQRLKNHGLEMQRQRQVLVQALYQGFGTIKEARVLNRERFFEARMEDSIRRMAHSARFKMLANKVVAPTTEFVGIVGLLGLVLALFMLEWPSDKIIVTLSLFVIGLVRLRQALNAILQQFTNLRYNLVSVNPVYDDLIELRDMNREERKPRPIRQRDRARILGDKVELRGVAYSYGADERYSLNGVDVEIRAGQAVAFVGPTGAGKSTLVDVLLGLLRPQEGAVYVDGVKLDAGNLADWQTRIGYVPQSIYLLDDTIRRNIALGLGDEEIDEEAVLAAARKAQLDSFLDRQPQGLDTVIGEGGVRLSGGERQRIGIARALYHDPEVLILDEATSSLDNETERAVVAAVEAEKGQRTIVMIAHRLSTVRNCHMLYFLKNGKVEASGDFHELQRRSRDFRAMAEGAELRASA